MEEIFGGEMFDYLLNVSVVTPEDLPSGFHDPTRPVVVEFLSRDVEAQIRKIEEELVAHEQAEESRRILQEAQDRCAALRPTFDFGPYRMTEEDVRQSIRNFFAKEER